MSDVTPGQAALPPLPPKWTGKFRKRPVVVEAVQLIDDLRNHTKIAAWIEGNGGHAEIPFAEPCLFIETLEGRMRAGIGWWVVRGVKGEFCAVRPDVFEETYEPADFAARQPQPAPGVPEGCDPRLLDGLRKFGDEWGPLGVAIAAASLTSRDALIAATDPGAVRKPADDVKPAPELAAAMAALAGELEAEAFRLAPPGAPEDPPDMADYIRAEALSVAASRIRDRAGVPS